jgi:dTDP-3-amino-3,4,6-trideoxy-alpha-D-glucose transaminase
MQIPFGDFKRQYIELQRELDDAMQRVVQSGAYILGPSVKAFEADFAAYCETPYCIGVGNGTDAIQLGLIALGVRSGDEVITVANTGVPGTAAIIAVGAVPVFVDVDPHTRNMNPALIEQAITPRTRAIMPVHLYGLMADMPAIMAIAQRHGIPVIEDVAQAQGARLAGARAGSIGAVAAFSFYPSKNLGAIGDGGALTTQDSGIDAELRKLRVYGWERKYYSTVESGINSRLDELQAAILSVKLRHLEASTARRVQIAAYYNTQLADSGLLLPQTPAGYAAVYHLYVVQTPMRDAYMAALKEAGVTTDIHYPLPTHHQPIYTQYAPSWGLPVTEKQAQEVFSLPNFPELSDAEVEYVASATRQARLPVKGK